MRRNLPRLGLVLQLFAIILLPLTVLLVAITFGSISVHNRAMRNLVGERDQRAVSIAAGALSAEFVHRSQEVHSLSLLLESNPSLSISSVFASLVDIPSVSNSGIAAFDSQGNLLEIKGYAGFWNAMAGDKPIWQSVYQAIESRIGYSTIFSDPANGGLYYLISKPTVGKQVLVGVYDIPALAARTLVNLAPPGRQLSMLLVSDDHRILYRVGNLTDQSPDHPGVAQALQGQSGLTYVNVAGDEHVTAYSPVIGVGWALITEESWEAVVTPTLRASQIAPIVLVPAVLIMLLALYLGASQVVRPLQMLESKASTLANGDFMSINQPVGGIAEIQHLQSELILMANKVREAQRSLHGYIGAITAAQEDERRRVARELHDDTLQALIALKQRVQLAQLELQPDSTAEAPHSAELDDIVALTERTIENLRRLTRDLRPAYLEDLGLVPALEMLARETGQSASIPVEFHRQGSEQRLDSALELALYRIAQEACSNIIRHAKATQASVTINYSGDSIVLSVEDNGVGFTVPTSSVEYASIGHYGLLGMHERAELVGVALSIRSSPGHGTHLEVTLTVKNKVTG